MASPALLVLPFVLGQSAREGAWGNVGIVALLLLLVVLPPWLRPYAIWQTGTAHLDGDVLTVYTLRDRRVLDLSHVQRVTVWSLDARGVWAKLSGDGIPPVWLNWSGYGFGTSERVQALVLEVATREGVVTNAAARDVLELPGAPSGWPSLARWLRDLAVTAGYGVAMAAALLAYDNVRFGFAPWASP